MTKPSDRAPKKATKKEAKDLYRRLIKKFEEANLALYEKGRILYTIWETQAYLHLGHQSFKSFAEDLPMSTSSAYNHRRIYKRFVLELGLKKKDLAGLEPCKAVIICRVVTRANVRMWIERCRRAGEREVRQMVRRAVGCTKKYRVKMHFTVQNDDVDAVNAAIHLAQQMYDLDHIGDGLAEVCHDYLARHRKGAV